MARRAKDIVKEGTVGRPVFGRHNAAQSKSQREGESQRGSESKGEGQSQGGRYGRTQVERNPQEASRAQGQKDGEACGSGSRSWKSRGDEMGKGRVRPIGGLRSPSPGGGQEGSHHRRELLPPGMSTRRDSDRDKARSRSQLHQAEGHRDPERRAVTVRDGSPRRGGLRTCVQGRMQPRGGIGQLGPHPKDTQDGEAHRRRKLGDQPRGSPRCPSTRRTERLESQGRGPQRSRTRETSRREEGFREFRREKEKEKEETKEGQERREGRKERVQKEEKEEERGRRELRYGQCGQRKETQEGSPEVSISPLQGHRPRSKGESAQQGDKEGQEEGQEAQRQGDEFRYFEQLIWEQRTIGGASGGEFVRGEPKSQASIGRLSGGPDQPSSEPDEDPSHSGDRTPGLSKPVASYRHGVLSPTPGPKGTRARSEGAPYHNRSPGHAAEEQAGLRCGPFSPATEVHRTDDVRHSLDGRSKARSLTERKRFTHTWARNNCGATRNLPGSQDEVGGHPSRGESPKRRRTRQREERSEGPEQRRRQREERWQRPAEQGGWRKEKRQLRRGKREDDRRESSGALAPGEDSREREEVRNFFADPEGGNGKTEDFSGALAPGEDKIEGDDTWALAYGKEEKRREKSKGAGAAAPGKVESEDNRVRQGRKPEDEVYEKGTAMALQPVTSDDFPGDQQAHSGLTYELSPLCNAGDFIPGPNSFHDSTGTTSGATEPVLSGEAFLKNDYTSCLSPRKSEPLPNLSGFLLGQCGKYLLQRLLEVLPLRSQSTGKRSKTSLYPLPTSRDVLVRAFPSMSDDLLSWTLCLCFSLNSLWGECLFYDGEMNKVQVECMKYLVEQADRLVNLRERLEIPGWDDYLAVKTVDYKGDEVKVARFFSWSNIFPALPGDVGSVPLAEVCEYGCKHYVENFDLYLRPQCEWELRKAPRVMVDDDCWGGVCAGLVQTGVCVFLEESEIHHVNGVPLLNGMFGVTKDDWTPDGVEIFRLIMNLIPLNRLCLPLSGDVGTLPAWSSMNPFFLQPGQNLLISSEDVKCFFYTMRLPDCWVKFLAFNKLVPDDVLPAELRGKRVYVASRVLPMGFLNSVSLAQHVHRNLVSFSRALVDGSNAPEGELRKDQAFSVANPNWRIYLDNYDLLERVTATHMVEIQGTLAPGALALRQAYEVWDVPRNIKKSVERQPCAEVQGATIDGIQGVAYPRESKLAKYFGLALSLLELDKSSQKQWQVVCGGLVYFTMFRRALLGSLNKVWSHIEGFNQGHRWQTAPADCKLEVYRLLGLLPLAVMDFRLPMHKQITCSDASTSGGGVCASVATTLLGQTVSLGSLRGESPDVVKDQAVLVVGLFDGLGALRVAVDVLGIQVLGYVSVERNPAARRVVESHFPGVVVFEDVLSIDTTVVKALSCQFSQACLVLLGAGPPCQGVSGLNVDRRGALKDERSCLFAEVPRIRDLFKAHFSWCPTYSLMESVASMDSHDRDIMTQAIGCDPILCDAGELTWCHRPRLYWCDWELVATEGFSFSASDNAPVRLHLSGCQDISEVTKGGWLKVDPELAFPTFTTSRPRPHPGRKPAGIKQCTSLELQRWTEDEYRFPPYQYCEKHCLVNSNNLLRIPDEEERELMLGFPLHYTATCVGKGLRKGKDYVDTRLTLLGNSWSVPVVACLLSQLFSFLGFSSRLSPDEILKLMKPGSSPLVQGRLFRLPLNPSRQSAPDCSAALAYKLGNLISIKARTS